MEIKGKHVKLTPVSTLHYIKLTYRTVILFAALFVYIQGKLTGKGGLILSLEKRPVIVHVIWIVYAIEMVLRFFPSKLESPGCQKQFERNYIKSGKTEIIVHDNNAAILVVLVWVAFNAVFGALHMVGMLDDGFLLLICCAYAVCDMICILFFCPFQTWLLKNKCCSSCRIYNWDYAMMFTPLFFIPSSFSWSLLALSFALLVRWEILFFRYPERFSENTNDYLKCTNCTEKLCTHKKQLHSLWRRIAEFTEERTRRLRG